MDYKRFTAILPLIIQQVIALITERQAVAEERAIEMLYTSELYSTLEEEETKLWHLSPHALYDLFLEEQQTGKITYPEEA